MNFKLVNLFAVCLITLAVIFPSLTVFGVVWEKHLEFVETHHTIHSEFPASFLQTNSPQNNDFPKLYSHSNETNLNSLNRYPIHHLWRWIFLFIPFSIGVAIFFYDRYLVYRANIFQQQVEMLEKLWQQSLEK